MSRVTDLVPAWHMGPLDSFYLWSTVDGPEDAEIVTAAYVRQESRGALPRPEVMDCDGEGDGPALSAGVTRWALGRVEPRGPAAVPLVAWNAPHALTVLDREAGRHGAGGLSGGLRPVIDPHVMWRIVNPGQAPRRGLRDLCQDFGIDDVDRPDGYAFAAIKVARELAARYPELGCLPPSALHAAQACFMSGDAGGNPAPGPWPFTPRKEPVQQVAPAEPDWTEFRAARDELVRAALRSLLTEELRRDDNDEEVREAEEADDALALAAQALTRATGSLPHASQPAGWPS